MKPRLLLISLIPCYPLHHGGALAQYYFLDGLKDRVDFVLCTQINSVNEEIALKTLQEKIPSLKIYSFRNFTDIDHSPKVTIKAGIKTLLKNLLFYRKIQTSPFLIDDFSDPYFQHIDNNFKPQFIELIHNVIEKEHIQQIQFDFYDTIDLCYALPAGVKKIFVNHEVRFKRLKLASAKSPESSEYKNFLIEKTKNYELNCIRRMDEVVVFNNDDADLLKSCSDHITVSPFAIPDELVFGLSVSKEFKQLLFIGGEGHNPNVLGLKWFLDEIYVPNEKVIKYPFHIIGNWSGLFKQQYSEHQNIVFLGVVSSVRDYFVSSIFVNPILTGAGIRTKILHAFSNNVPVLSTTFGAEGCFDEENKDHIGFFDSAEEFISLIEKTDFEKLASNGNHYYKKEFDKEKLLNIRMSVYE